MKGSPETDSGYVDALWHLQHAQSDCENVTRYFFSLSFFITKTAFVVNSIFPYPAPPFFLLSHRAFSVKKNEAEYQRVRLYKTT
ncbi:MAG: hypothetical protein D3925_06830 [Candidatus Electrothrix sp. AR5]|nr:hypothetical protein [Candidatus Electrothrix sp. AR5]